MYSPFDIVRMLDNLPKIVKLVLSLFLDIVWIIYRILKSADEQNTLGIILGILLILFGLPFLWIVDFICILMNDHVWWF